MAEITRVESDGCAEAELLLGQIADEFAERMERGEVADVEEYATRHPALADTLRRVLPAIQLMRAYPPDQPPDQPQEHQQSSPAGRLGDFRLIREVGRGGMGVVYEAEQMSLERRVALKVLPMAGILDDRQLTRFKNEARAAATLLHPNIVPVHAVGSASGTHFYAMQFIEGQSLAEVIARLHQEAELDVVTAQHAGTQTRRVARRVASDDDCDTTALLSPQEVSRKAAATEQLASDEQLASGEQAASDTVPIAEFVTELSPRPGQRYRSAAGLAADVAEALEYAHSMGIVHRDIKPGNLLLDRQGKIWVADFGLAQLETDAGLTMTGAIVGTLRYMSPEQAGGQSGLADPRSDIYSLGLTLYELLTLRPAFPAKERSKLFQQISSEDPPRLRQLDPSAPRDLETILLKAIAKSPQDRYATAGEFAADLRRFLEDRPIHAKPPGILEVVKKWRRRNRTAVATALTTLVLAVGLAGSLLLSERSRTLAALAGERDQRQVAEARKDIARRNESEAIDQRNQALKSQYHAEIVLSQADWEHGYLQRLNRKLMGHLPLSGQPNRRGWEWNYLWSLCHPEVRTLHSVAKESYVAWSPDGEYIAASGDIWRAESGELVRRLSMSRILRYRSAWSPDSRMFAWGMAADDCCTYVWDRETDEVRELRGHDSSVWSVAWSPDGKRLASGGIDRKILIWDIATGEIVRTYGAGNHVSSVAWSPDGELLAACIKNLHLGVWNPVLRVWKSADGEPVVRAKLSISGEANSAQLSWHPDGDQLAISASNRWCLVKRSDWTTTRQQDLEVGRIRDVAWSPDGRTLALADGETVLLWEPSKEQPERMLRGHSGRIVEVDWNPDGRQLVSSDDAGEVKTWDLTVPFSSPGFTIDGPVQSLSWLADNQTLAVVHQSDSASSFWNALDGQRMSVEPPMSEGQVLWSPDRQLVACYGDDETAEIRVLKAERGEVHAVWRGAPGEKIARLAWSPDGRMLAIGKLLDNEKSVALWDVDREQAISTWLYHGPSGWTPVSWGDRLQLVWSPEATHVAIATIGEEGDPGTPIWYGHVYVVNVADAATVLKHRMPHRADVRAVAWKPDGRAFVAATTDGLIEAVDVESRQMLFSTRLHSTTVNSLAWSPDGRRIVSAADDGSIKLLAADDGGDLLIFPLDAKATHVVWSPAGNRLAAATADGQVHVWDAARADAMSEQGDRRGELAWAYYRARPHESSAEGDARRRQMLRLAPDTLEFWQARGEVRAALGDFQGASEEFAKAMSPGMRRSFDATLAYGLSLLATGRMEAYREHRVSMLSEFAGTQVPSSGGHIAWLCALAPNENLDTKTLAHLGRATLARDTDDGSLPDISTMLQLGASLHRHGLYQEATDLLTNVVERLERSSDPAQRSVQADVLYFLAMARHQLGHAFQARRYLDQAAKIAEQIPSPTWRTTVQHQVLEREARTLIENQ